MKHGNRTITEIELLKLKYFFFKHYTIRTVVLL